MRGLLDYKINFIGTVFVAILSTVLTISTYEIIINNDLADEAHMASQPSIGSTVLDCETGVYSPIQKTCVSQHVFDQEMKRLFSALGIDASPDQSSQ